MVNNINLYQLNYFFAIHYIEDYDGLCKKVYDLLVDAGFN